MKINDFTVMKSSDGKHHYFYGNLEDYEPEDLEGLNIVDKSKWFDSDYSVILGNIIEDRNHHWMTPVPSLLIDSLTEVGIMPEKRDEVMRKFCERMESEIFK